MQWYQLPITYQKQTCLAIRNAQNAAVMRMGSLYDINFEMAANVSLLYCLIHIQTHTFFRHSTILPLFIFR